MQCFGDRYSAVTCQGVFDNRRMEWRVVGG